MADTRFFKKNGSFKLSYLAEISGGKVQKDADNNIVIHNVAPLGEAGEGDITFLQNPKYIDNLKDTKAAVCIISPKHAMKAPKELTLLISDNPYFTYAKIAEKFYHKENLFFSVSEFSYVDATASLGALTVVCPGAYIGPGCIVGKNCVIHPNVTLYNCIIGDNVIIHGGARIGQDGFGYAFGDGYHQKVPQLGRVLIENNVEIGANTTIDRGSGPDTIIGYGTKIDNLVQIGHNCKIGKHCIIVSQVGISGSTEIGDYTAIAGQAGIAGHLKIGSKVQIAAKAGVMKDIVDGDVVGGYPAVPIKDFHRQSIILKKLVEGKNDQSDRP